MPTINIKLKWHHLNRNNWHHPTEMAGIIRTVVSSVYQTKPKYHIFGHIHEDYGSLTNGETTFINASVLDDWYEMKNEPAELNFCCKSK